MSTSRSARKIFVAEDDADDRLLFQQAFHELGVEQDVRFFTNGEDLLSALRNGRNSAMELNEASPGLILLDLNMPRMDGHQVLAAIKNDLALRVLPVVILTTSTAEDDILRSYAGGVNSFVSKPNTYGQLVKLLGILLTYWLQTVRLP